jgi:hypothetical protein
MDPANSSDDVWLDRGSARPKLLAVDALWDMSIQSLVLSEQYSTCILEEKKRKTKYMLKEQ